MVLNSYGGYSIHVVDTQFLWWILNSYGGYSIPMVATQLMWWLLNSCGGYSIHVVATQFLWWLLNSFLATRSFGGYLTRLASHSLSWWLRKAIWGHKHSLAHGDFGGALNSRHVLEFISLAAVINYESNNILVLPVKLKFEESRVYLIKLRNTVL